MKYYCDLCGDEFDTVEECEKHVRTHYTNWKESDNNKIIEELRCLSERAYDYRFSGMVLGYFLLDFSNLMHEAAKRIEDAAKVPSVTPAHKKEEWISCNDRLPKENEYVDDVCKYYLIQDEYGDMHVAHYTHVGWIPIDSLFALGDDVVAWRSLPEKYKAESDEDE